MKTISKMLGAAVVAALPAVAGAQTMTPAETDSLSRAAATIMADGVLRSVASLEGTGVAFNDDVFNATLVAALEGKPTGFTLQTADEFIERMVDRMNRQYAAREEAFIDSIAAQPAALKLPSGTVLVVETEGEGVYPTAADKVEVKYEGRLSNGTVFDKTGDETVTFDVSRLVPGFTEGLQHMKPGGRYRLLIPASQGYGEKGIAGVIPGNSVLDFTVDLIGILPPEPKQ